MKKRLFFALAVMVSCTISYAQEKMKIEMKDGSVVSYDVENVSRFYFTTESGEEQLAKNCEITLLDELALTTQFALDVKYGSEVEYVLTNVYEPEANVDEAVDADLVADLIAGGNRVEKNTTVLTGSEMPEGMDLTIVLVAFNAQGQRGPLYRHHLTTHKSDEEPLAPVTSCQYNNESFFYTIEIDDSKVLKYYLAQEVGRDLTRINDAALGMSWRRLLANETQKPEYYTGRTFTADRPNGEPQLYLATWAVDFDGNYSDNIFSGFYHVEDGDARKKGIYNNSSTVRRNASKRMTLTAYNKDELMKLVKGIKYRVITTK